jgi:hypothetical protein
LTWKELKRFISDNNNEDKEEEIKLQSAERFRIFKDLPFWISSIEEHKKADIANNGKCCFNHIIGLPKKDGIDKPIFDYEMQLVNALDNNKSVFVKKARGVGITEILLRYMSWLAVSNSDYSGCRFHIVTGPRINLAEELIDRIHSLFMNSKLGIDCKTVGPIIYVNNVTIQAFPSHTVSTMRGYTDVKFILIDEGAFFAPGQQEEVRAVCEGYRAKTNPHIVMISTPYKPGDIFEQIDRDPNSIFKKLSFHYTVGLDKIYNTQDIEKERKQPYFRREFELAYSVGTGNVFIEETLQHAEELGRRYRDRPYNPDTQKSLGVDVGFGSSKTAFVIIEYIDGLVHIIYSKQFENSSTNQMAAHTYNLIRKYRLDNGINKTFVDGSASGFIRSVKIALGGNEIPNYEVFVEKSKRDKIPLYKLMNVVPVSFGEKGRAMLGNVKKWIDKGRVAIDAEAHPELMTDLRIATSDEEMSLNKIDYTMDLLDSLRLAFEYIVY